MSTEYPSYDTIVINVQDLITRVDIFPVGKSNVLALAKLWIADFFVVNVFLKQGQHGPYLSLPGHKDSRTGVWIEDVAFTTPEVRESVTQIVITSYGQAMQKSLS